MNRPPDMVMLNFRVKPSFLAAIDQVCAQLVCSRGEFIRDALRVALEKLNIPLEKFSEKANSRKGVGGSPRKKSADSHSQVVENQGGVVQVLGQIGKKYPPRSLPDPALNEPPLSNYERLLKKALPLALAAEGLSQEEAPLAPIFLPKPASARPKRGARPPAKKPPRSRKPAPPPHSP